MFSYKINAEEVYDKMLDYSDVISVIHYTKILTDENGNSVSYNDATGLAVPSNPKGFISYDKITNENRISFIEKTIGSEAVAKIDATLEQMLADSLASKPRLVQFD